jgi:transcriptional regulator with XRE-family HTH domain
MSGITELGAYLRARRDLVAPEAVGVTPSGRRRVPGLRREEVAMLAGISSEYYLRLERGRDQHPSPQVLDALARVLMLDDNATAYLHGLAQRRRQPSRRRPERVAAGLEQLVLNRTDVGAFVQGRYLDVLVANPLATALSPCQAVGVNLLRATFLDPGVRALYGDAWAGIAAGVVGSVRALAGPDNRDGYLAGLVGELSVRSEEFRGLWARRDVGPRTSGAAVLHHPQVGDMRLQYEKLAVTGADGQVLVIFHAAPGSRAADSLALLSQLAYDGSASEQPGGSGRVRQELPVGAEPSLQAEAPRGEDSPVVAEGPGRITRAGALDHRIRDC